MSTDVVASLAMPATEFDALTDAQLDALPQLPLVVARCAPSTKVRMIDALHRRGRYCAMTGDGINDAPSLKRSDIGIAMGSGSDVAKESSDIVLTDDNFASILNAIEEGRRIFDNIQKFILHVLAANFGFVIALLAGLAFKDATGISVFQLSPVEIIWMLVGTGAFCETGLGFEKAVPDILNRPPHSLKHGVFPPEFFADMFVYGLMEAACIMGTFTVVVYGFNGGNLGVGCNNEFSESCEAVFRARATSYTTTTWVFLLFAWQLIDTRRSFFDFEKGVKHGRSICGATSFCSTRSRLFSLLRSRRSTFRSLIMLSSFMMASHGSGRWCLSQSLASWLALRPGSGRSGLTSVERGGAMLDLGCLPRKLLWCDDGLVRSSVVDARRASVQ